MTIYKVLKGEKKVLKKDALVVEPLTGGDAERAAPRAVAITFSPQRRSRMCVNLFLLLIALLVLSAGVVGGIYLFKYLAHKHRFHQRVTVEYTPEKTPTPLPNADYIQYNGKSQHDDTDQRTPDFGYLMMEEDVEIEVDEDVERIMVPQFDECRSSVIVHDFYKNYTAIVDNDEKECFIMKLDRKKFSPPKTFLDLLSKYARGYYMPKVDVVRREYRVVTPPLEDLSFTGRFIMMECKGYDSYKLVKKETDMFNLEEKVEMLMRTYGYTDMKTLRKEVIYK